MDDKRFFAEGGLIYRRDDCGMPELWSTEKRSAKELKERVAQLNKRDADGSTED
jgi:hypothetical protein